MAFADSSVVSSDIVGYQGNTANASRNTMMAPTFLSVGSTTGCTLADLTVTGYDPAELNEDDEYEGGCALGDFIVNFLSNTGSASASYYWVDDGETGPAWCDKYGSEVEASSVTIPAGVAMWTRGSGYTLQSAGKVGTADIAFVMNASRQTAAGNCTPVDLTLGKVTVSGYDAAELNEDDEYEGGCSLGDFILNFLTNTGSAEASYYWVDDGETGPAWCDKYGSEVNTTSIAFPAGKGAWIRGSGYTFNIPAPEL